MNMQESIRLIGKIEACENLIARAITHKANSRYSLYLLDCLEAEIKTLDNPYLREVWNRRLSEKRTELNNFWENQIAKNFNLVIPHPTIHS